MRKPRLLFWHSVAILLLALAAAGGIALGADSGPVAKPPPGQYLFVESWTAVSGTGKLPQLCIDFPGYSFDTSSGMLAPFSGSALPPLLPSAWGFAGSGESRSGAAGCGAASDLRPIASLPYSTTVGVGTGTTSDYGEQLRSAPVELLAITADGQLTARIDGETVMLAPGQSWRKVVGADLKNDAFDGHYEITSSVTNYGWHDRASIHGPTQFNWLPMIRS